MLHGVGSPTGNPQDLADRLAPEGVAMLINEVDFNITQMA
ncbi:hypothetical protein BDI4_40077 [Burkholderia diffusa]|nr:hypothetical protein BDI4_40077 [Burkholderia diffusa]